MGRLKIPPNAFIFTIDIDSLYTNIETYSGVEAVKKCMEKFPDTKRPDEYILKFLKINLTKNYFEFNYFAIYFKVTLANQGYCDGQNVCPIFCKYFHGRLGGTSPFVFPF